ncbi:MAG: DUF1257 domain-containing protein [Calothrix sp. MO_192.B10]|nr:DUF1257 domain-containing protein [Calothrix sp. MO_192.B10]
MSHFSTIKTQYNNKNVLLQSLKQMGLKVTEHEQPIQLQTNWSSQAFANLVVERSQISSRSDIGFVYEDDTYKLVCDDYDLRHSKLPNFKQELGTNYAVATAKRLGYRVQKQETVKGQVQITLGARR